MEQLKLKSLERLPWADHKHPIKSAVTKALPTFQQQYARTPRICICFSCYNIKTNIAFEHNKNSSKTRWCFLCWYKMGTIIKVKSFFDIGIKILTLVQIWSNINAKLYDCFRLFHCCCEFFKAIGAPIFSRVYVLKSSFVYKMIQ